jgi:hypothetical protein
MTSARVAIPHYGIWVADIELATTDALTPAVTMVIGNLTMIGHVYRMAAFAGTRTARVVGGYGGWPTVVPSQSYYDANGIRKSVILGDVAAAVGESINVTNDIVLATTFVREEAPAQRILNQVVGTEWYINNAGVTQLGDRSSAFIKSEYNVIKWSGNLGKVEIATEDYVSWMPGNTFRNNFVTETQTISLSVLTLDNAGKARIEVLCSP